MPFVPGDEVGELSVARPVRLHNQMPIATFFWAEDGGPIRTIIDGRKTRPTGTLPLIKAGFRSMPWDSTWEELAMQMADISSRVDYALAQPHRIEISVQGNRGKPLIYFPDLLLRTHRSFLQELQSGSPFSSVCAVPSTQVVSAYELETIVIEIKADFDPRDDDPVYQRKLKIAKELYLRRGFHFFEIRATKHLKAEFSKVARLMDWRKLATADIHDELACLGAFNGARVTSRARLERALGGGQYGRAKLNALHYRQFVSIDLTEGILPSSNVWLLGNAA